MCNLCTTKSLCVTPAQAKSLNVTSAQWSLSVQLTHEQRLLMPPVHHKQKLVVPIHVLSVLASLLKIPGACEGNPHDVEFDKIARQIEPKPGDDTLYSTSQVLTRCLLSCTGVNSHMTRCNKWHMEQASHLTASAGWISMSRWSSATKLAKVSAKTEPASTLCWQCIHSWQRHFDLAVSKMDMLFIKKKLIINNWQRMTNATRNTTKRKSWHQGNLNIITDLHIQVMTFIHVLHKKKPNYNWLT